MTSDARVRYSYTDRASEYSALLGDIDQMDTRDRARIALWAARVDGRILDVGCGPGHWTAFLTDRGCAVEGIDLVPDFVKGASARFPHIPFKVGSLSDLDAEQGSFGGVLAWYSLIHAPAEEIPSLLAAVRRVTPEGGRLLLGFFDGPDGEPFPHAVTTAHTWTVLGMAELLGRAGFLVNDSESRVSEGQRPHASISATAV